MLEYFQDNQFASGLIVTTLLAAGLAYMRNIPQMVSNLLWSQFSVTAEIKNSDESFRWLLEWLNAQPYSKKARRLYISTKIVNEDDNCNYDSDVQPRKNRPRVLFTPAIGQHLLWYKNRFVWLGRGIEKSSTDGNNSGSKPQQQLETLSLTILGRDQSFIREIINDAMDLALPPNIRETRIIQSQGAYWKAPLRRTPRTKNSVVLNGSILDNLVSDVKKFLDNHEWYESLGIPYRRGYLLHGQPGSGKTSTVLAVAGELDLDIYIISLGDRLMDDTQLSILMAAIATKSIVLLEDIDAAFKTRALTKKGRRFVPGKEPEVFADGEGPQMEQTDRSITFSGLLNAIDGAAAVEGRILFMTTNHRDFLDPALIRPGRADLHIQFDYATKEQATKMFTRFFQSSSEEQAIQFGQLTPDDVTMAAIQDHLIIHHADINSALANWPPKQAEKTA